MPPKAFTTGYTKGPKGAAKGVPGVQQHHLKPDVLPNQADAGLGGANGSSQDVGNGGSLDQSFVSPPSFAKAPSFVTPPAFEKAPSFAPPPSFGPPPSWKGKDFSAGNDFSGGKAFGGIVLPGMKGAGMMMDSGISNFAGKGKSFDDFSNFGGKGKSFDDFSNFGGKGKSFDDFSNFGGKGNSLMPFGGNGMMMDNGISNFGGKGKGYDDFTNFGGKGNSSTPFGGNGMMMMDNGISIFGGKGKGFDKGKSLLPFGGGSGCFNCGGPHMARECPDHPANGGKGKSSKGKGKGKKDGKERGPSGPNLDRKRITDEPVTGTVSEWKGKYGWIEPTMPIEHEKAARNRGRLYVSMSDLMEHPEVQALTPDSVCQFHVFEDASGLGAEEVLGS